MKVAGQVKKIGRELSKNVDAFLVRHKNSGEYALAYNPLNYAREPFERYVELYCNECKANLFLGMNPGPFGMAQTGIPFGDVTLVTSWLKVEGEVGKPETEHPKRPIDGFSCHRKEISGTRLWSWARDRYVTPKAFFQNSFVWNYCPLVFMKESGGNITPDKLSTEMRNELFAICDVALLQLVEALKVKLVIGVGKFAEKQAKNALPLLEASSILHPSPASPKANKNWVGEVESQLELLGVL